MGSTEDFLRLLNEQNVRLAARATQAETGVDPVWLQKDQERREKWGQLRAREHPSHRPFDVHSVFGHVPLEY